MNPTTTISTYDVFDTLLTRRVCDPKAVFYWLGGAAGKRGLTGLTPEAFRKARVEAEALARVGVRNGEADLIGIYKVLGQMAGCTCGQLQELMGMELDWERRMITTVPGAKEAVESERLAGRQIHFLSDMYLPADFLEGLLREKGFMHNGDKLWVSNAHQAGKGSGGLYSLFLEQTRISPNQVQHHGNDWRADVEAPRRLGIRAIHRADGNPTAYELFLERHSQETHGWTSLMAGAGRLVRLRPATDARIAGLRRITANVLCPVLTCYVLWILQQAKHLGLRRLYFISRDGYVPYLLAKHIAAKLLPEVECRYLYGSRQAWHLAGLREVDQAALQWMTGHCDGVTCGSLLRRVGLTWEKAQQIAPGLTATMGGPDNPVTEAVQTAFKEALQSEVYLIKTLMGNSKRAHNLLTHYAAQEGFFRDVPTGMVEIGWSGRTRASLERSLTGQNVANLHWLYLGLHHGACLKREDLVHCFLYGPEARREEIPYLPVVVESFCLAPHGSVTGYREESNTVVPVFREDIEAQLESWGRGHVLDAVREYVQQLPVELGEFPDTGDLVSVAYTMLSNFCTKPTEEEARLWGAIPFEHDQAAEKAYPLAPEARVNAANLKNALIFGSVDRACLGNSFGIWAPGSWAARKRPLYLLMLAARAGYVRILLKQLLRRVSREFCRSRLVSKV